MRILLGLTLTLGMAAASFAASAPHAKKKTTAVRRPSTTAHAAPGVRRPAVRTTAVTRRKSAPVKPVTWRTRQLAPSADRYKEIQEALAARGYLSAEQSNGAWNDASIDALKRFQMDQNLDPTGKLNSLSLIALGLGPKHDAVPVQIAAPAPEQINQ